MANVTCPHGTGAHIDRQRFRRTCVARNSPRSRSAGTRRRLRHIIAIVSQAMKAILLLVLFVTTLNCRAVLLLAERNKAKCIIVVDPAARSEEHTSELQSRFGISY